MKKIGMIGVGNMGGAILRGMIASGYVAAEDVMACLHSEENCRIASDAHAHAMDERELAVFERVKTAINRSVKVGCTGCGYCMPCPQGVDIPTCFQAYNRSYTDSWFGGMAAYFMCTTLRQDKTVASKCIGCGKCEKHCPQQVHIREELKNVKRRMENPVYHAAKFVADKIYKY